MEAWLGDLTRNTSKLAAIHERSRSRTKPIHTPADRTLDDLFNPRAVFEAEVAIAHGRTEIVAVVEHEAGGCVRGHGPPVPRRRRT